MATIFYSLMGEGRGHAARARAMVQRLRDRHRIVLYTSHDALAFLRELYGASGDVDVRETAGLKFHYSGERLNFTKTVTEGLSLWWNVDQVLATLEQDFARERPDLVVTDFEPLLPRAARRVEIPVLSLDHQHFLVAYDLSSLPLYLRSYALAMRGFVKAFGIRAQRTVVSAFYKPPLRSGYEEVVQVGPLLRPVVRETQPTPGEHVLVYLRRSTPPEVLKLLSSLEVPMQVYGLGERPAHGNLQFRPINEQAFVEDLASSDCVIAAAGNQVLGEALHFRKPVFALPEQKHHEQCINACFLEQLGGGAWMPIERVSGEDLRAFLKRRDQFREQLEGSLERFDGTDAAALEIESML
jgi:uncharacterized protein (TIGR00661 family)